ncbi:MAG: outer membrane protein assembly factor BamE [Alphaproteobacteria bacterium]|nr:outer membrane protein assembly factor BamE [Alphaproteobacteria bacterium]
MSTRNIVFSTVAAAMLFLSGCSTDYFNQTEGNLPPKKDILAIKRGMSQEEVREILGSPSVISSLDHKSWIYMNSTMRRLAFLKPKEIERNVLAVEFNLDGKVEKVVQLTKDNGFEVSVSDDETPVMSNDEGFLQKYFGGVGQYLPVEPTKTNNGL